MHHLTFRGLGPFRDEQVVDFRRLSEAGLFVLEGPTGSGKSTIIDAIVFALYGGVAAAAADEGRLVSHFLPEGFEPFAELVFESTAGIFRVRRTPKYDRPKLRGSGMRTENATATLTRLGTPDAVDGEFLANRADEVGVQIERIVGLTRRQFLGTIVLPQGEFADFLRADGKDRQPILQRIFRTGVYKRLQERLWEGKKTAEKQRLDADHLIDVRFEAFRQSARLPDDQPPVAGLDLADTDAVIDVLETTLRDSRLALDLATEAQAQSVAERAAAIAEYEAVRHRVGLRDRLRQALAQQAALTERVEEYRAWVTRVAMGDRAKRVGDALAAAERAGSARSSAAAVVDLAGQAVPAEDRLVGVSGLTTARDALQNVVAQLAAAEVTEGELPSRAAALQTLVDSRESMAAALAGVESGLETLPAEILDLQTQLRTAVEEAATADGRQAEVEQLAERAAAAVALEEARGELSRTATDVETALADEGSAHRQVADLRTQYLAGVAAELGRGLAEGAPCPVCGSRDHPAPAVPAVDHVGKEHVDAAERMATGKREVLERQREAHRRADMNVARLEQAAAGRGRRELEEALRAAHSKLHTARQAAERADRLADEIRTLEGRRDKFAAERTRLQGEVAGTDATVTVVRQSLDADEQIVAAAREGFPSVHDRMVALATRADHIDRLIEALAALAAADDQHETALRALAQSLEREQFPDPGAARDARLEASAEEALRELIRDYERQSAAVEAELRSPDLQGLDPQEQEDAQPAADRVAETEVALAATNIAHTRALQVVEDCTKTAGDARSALLDRHDLITRTEPLIQVAKLCYGYNAQQMDLATYVLLRRFEAVVAAANERLRIMSDGRLELVQYDEADDRRRRAGLGLQVLDLRTDRARSTKTLSGGESFYTALSLALGLAAVVSGEAGGTELGTLFVDEGFGSLDGETLEDVLTVLTSLRDAGRVVGVVSHVDEMKQRISERIEVRREDDRGPSHLTVRA